MWFAAKEAVEKKAMGKGRQVGLQESRKEERERIGQALEELKQQGIPLMEKEIARILSGASPSPTPSRPYGRLYRRGSNGR